VDPKKTRRPEGPLSISGAKWHTVRLSNVRKAALTNLERTEADQPVFECVLFERTDFSTRAFWGEPSSHSRLVRTVFDRMIDHYTKLLRQHHAPEMAKLKPLLDPN